MVYTSGFSDEELEQYIKRVCKWLSDDEIIKLAAEFDRRGLKVQDPYLRDLIEKIRLEETAREKAKQANQDARRAELR